MTGDEGISGLNDAVRAAEAVGGRAVIGVRPVDPGTGGRAWVVALEGPSYLVLGANLAPVTSLTRARDVAQTGLAAEVVEDTVDSDALRVFITTVGDLFPFDAEMPVALAALRRCAAACRDLADWRDDPARAVASMVGIDAAVAIQGRAHAAYAGFVSATEPLVEQQTALDPDLLGALTAVESAAAAAGLGAPLGGMLGAGAASLMAAADEMAQGHLTPLR
ncbi:MAG: hypothetical protein EXQ74_07250 [Thermoleophilia bacterium]|nr:hypothetical protein [Thermoleophilia bacterium]